MFTWFTGGTSNKNLALEPKTVLHFNPESVWDILVQDAGLLWHTVLSEFIWFHRGASKIYAFQHSTKQSFISLEHFSARRWPTVTPSVLSVRFSTSLDSVSRGEFYSSRSFLFQKMRFHNLHRFLHIYTIIEIWKTKHSGIMLWYTLWKHITFAQLPRY